jgi:O-antigen chain-terminating methyltransferase
MRRTLERLAEERKSKEQEFAYRVNSLREKASDPSLSKQEIIASVLDLLEIQSSLMDAKDREWDALGSNHVGIIFKSMEWRVDRLAAETEDAKALVKKFLLLREKLDRLLAALEGGRKASPAEVCALLEPLEDWRYTGFENRFRGREEEVRKQQRSYLPYFQAGGRVLDLGCGRGEFLEILRENGIEGWGIDINGQMVDICLDKGLECRRGDILESLAGVEDLSLAGIFSSQVVEHLTPSYLKKLADVAFLKLKPGGTMVLETVNPTSVFALVQIYLLDLTHQKPIHPLALKFMLESAGFEEVEIKYSDPLETESLRSLPGTEEKTVILNQNIDALNKLLFAPPNYAAIGKKK